MKKIIFACFIFLMTTPVWAQKLHLEVEKYQLENGLKVLLHQDNSIPMVAVNLWYSVGSYDEEPNRTGLAHFFEHLMFKGTKKHTSGQFDKVLTSLGGENNAFTSRDYTGYYELIPSSALKKILELEADRMVNLVLDKDEIQKEREVVKEERRMRTENTPQGVMFETLMTMNFQGHSYEWPVIGSMKDLNAASMADFQNFYKKYYAPNNATLVIAGDFKADEVKSWVKRYFGSLKSSKIERKKPVILPTQKKRKFKRIQKFDNRVLGIYFQAPKAGEKDAYVLDVLSESLGSGEDSRLHKKMVDELGLASDVGLWNYSLKHSGALGLSVSLVGKKSFKSLEDLFFQEVQKVAKKGLSPAELKRSKDRLILDYVTSLTTINGKARVLAATEIVRGDYKKFFDDLKIYESVTNEDVKAAAKKYLKRKQANALYLGK